MAKAEATVEELVAMIQRGDLSLPEMQRVIASYSDRVVMGDTLDIAMAALFAGPQTPAPTIAKTVTTQLAAAPPTQAPSAPTAATSDLQGASQHYNRAMTALRAGDWSEFGIEMKKLGDQLSPPGNPTHP